MTRKKKWILLAVAVLIALGLVTGLSDEVDWHALLRSLETLDRGQLLAVAAVLPLFGFSIAVVYLAVGAVFGGWVGLAVVAGITVVHLLGSHWIARSFFRAPVQRFLHRRRHQLPDVPEGEEWAVALMTALVPGLPYFVRNYLLALSDIPLRIYFWICWPVYVLRSSVVLFLGDFSDGFSGQRLAVLGSVLVLKVAVCAYLIHRLRIHYKASHGPRAAPSAPAKKQAA